MRWGMITAALVLLMSFEVSAGSVLIYDGRGKLDRVVRPSPSGFVVYDNRGKIVSAVRQFGFNNPRIIDSETTNIRVLGSNLSDRVSTLRGGVGFD